MSGYEAILRFTDGTCATVARLDADSFHKAAMYASLQAPFGAALKSLELTDLSFEDAGEVSEPGTSAADADTALTGGQAALRATASAPSVFSESVGERQGRQPGSLTSLARLYDAIAAHLADDTADLTELAHAMTDAETLIAHGPEGRSERSPNAT